jgi:glutathione S-transferase
MRPILHHYENSPFAEKIRTLLGFKRIDWTSVLIPPIMPKPDLVALTGGYRKTPVLQIGADIYCDTALISRVLETLTPMPSVYPAASAGVAPILAQWADSTLFWTAIAYTLQPAGLEHMFAGQPPEVLKAFAADRAPFRASAPRIRVPEATQSLTSYMGEFETLLADDRSWLLGAAASIADFSVYHCIWFVSRGGPPSAILESYPRLMSWFKRMRSVGHGVSDRLESGAAVELAAAASPLQAGPENFLDTHSLGFGALVTIAAVDYGIDPVLGELVISRTHEIGLRRTDPKAGTVVVHFPRLGFEIRKAEPILSA